MILLTVVREVARGKTIARTLVNLRCRSVVLEGKGLDLGAKDGHSSQYRFLHTSSAEITYTDRFPSEPRVLRVDLEQEIPFPEGSQDFLLMFYVTHVLFDHLTAFREAYRVLRPGGRLIGASSFLHWLVPEPDDYGRLSGSALRRLFTEAGFEPVEVEPIGVGPFTASAHVASRVIRPRILRAGVVAMAMGMDRLLGMLTRKRWESTYPLAYFFEVTKPGGQERT